MVSTGCETQMKRSAVLRKCYIRDSSTVRQEESDGKQGCKAQRTARAMYIVVSGKLRRTEKPGEGAKTNEYTEHSRLLGELTHIAIQ